MKTHIAIAGAALLVSTLVGRADGAMGDSNSQAMGLGQAYTALARGPEAVFWNPANLGLSGTRKFSWELLGVGATVIAENNSFSVKTYNDYFTESNDNVSPRGTPYYIDLDDKVDLLSDVPGEGLKMDVEAEPMLALGLPINGGIAFPLPGGLQSALTIGLTGGVESEVPKDMVELFLFGNEFAGERVAAGKPEGYDISKWDGSGWAIASVNWAGARAWMPEQFEPYLSEFSVGGTLKYMVGAYGEVTESGGEGLVSRIEGATVGTYLITRSAGVTEDEGLFGIDTGFLNPDIGGHGFGLDLGVAGVTKNKKTSVSIGLLNLLDTFSWSSNVRQDSLFVTADDLRVTRAVDPDVDNFEDILDNEDVDGDGDVDFHKLLDDESFSRSLPAMLRMGVAHEYSPRLTLVGNYDQAFSEGFGVSTTPRLAGGVEYRLVPWLPVRFGLSVGGRQGTSSSFGFALGPFEFPHVQLRLLELAVATRDGFFPGLSKGSAISLQLLRLSLI